MSYVLFYSILLNGIQYVLVEQMHSLNQCRRLLPIVKASELVTDAQCAAVILDRKAEDE